MEEPFENPKLYELATWESLIGSADWQVFLKLIEEHKKHLTSECLMYLRKDDHHNAVRCEAKVEDMGKMLDLVKQSLRKLRGG